MGIYHALPIYTAAAYLKFGDLPGRLPPGVHPSRFLSLISRWCVWFYPLHHFIDFTLRILLAVLRVFFRAIVPLSSAFCLCALHCMKPDAVPCSPFTPYPRRPPPGRSRWPLRHRLLSHVLAGAPLSFTMASSRVVFVLSLCSGASSSTAARFSIGISCWTRSPTNPHGSSNFWQKPLFCCYSPAPLPFVR